MVQGSNNKEQKDLNCQMKAAKLVCTLWRSDFEVTFLRLESPSTNANTVSQDSPPFLKPAPIVI